MGRLGADVEALSDLAASLDAAARRLEVVATGLDRQVRRQRWHGQDAVRFERDWSIRHRPALAALRDACTRMASSLRHQAWAQRIASSASGTPTVPLARRSAVNTVADTAAPPPHLFPRVEERYEGGVDVMLAFGVATLQGDLTIERLDGGRARVSLTEAGGLGVGASAGAAGSVSIGDRHPPSTPANGLYAEGRAVIGLVHRRSWEVDQHEIGGLLARLAAAQGAAVTGLPRDMDPMDGVTVGGPVVGLAAGAVGAVVDGVVGFVTGSDPGLGDALDDLLTIPAPNGMESLAEVTLAGAIGGAVGERAGAGGHVGASGTVRVGTATTNGAPSTVIEAEGHATAGLTGALLPRLGIALPGAGQGEGALRIEVVEGSSRQPAHALVSFTSVAGTTLKEQVARIDLSGPAMVRVGTELRAVVAALGRGDVGGAVAAGERLAATRFPAENIQLWSSSGDLSARSVRANGQVGAGVSVGLTARGHMVRVER